MGHFTDKRVLLTGASDGLGAALARALGAEGARVLLFARRFERLEALAAELEATGGEAIVCAGDVTVQADLDRAVAALNERWGGIDVVIANAGIGEGVGFDDFDTEDAVRVVDVNLNGAIRTIGAALPTLLAQRSGHVVGVASPAGFRGLPRGATYSASKAGLTRFLESLRSTCRQRGIYVTTVHPGFVRTFLTAENDFPMPFLIEPDDAAARILAAVRRRTREVTFPLGMAVLMGAVRLLPNPLFDLVMRAVS